MFLRVVKQGKLRSCKLLCKFGNLGHCSILHICSDDFVGLGVFDRKHRADSLECRAYEISPPNNSFEFGTRYAAFDSCLTLKAGEV